MYMPTLAWSVVDTLIEEGVEGLKVNNVVSIDNPEL
jgi:hypothetical protein